ncbi:MAG TPA: DUF4159 domain-containing protein [Planctomycetaceae bacterium]|nr:DUF4159 domain-containing protein [Planctomycetaceae bacterium]
MRRRVWIGLICSAIVFSNDLARFQSARAADGSPDLSSAQVKDSIERVQKFLGTIQNRDGSFGFRSAGPASYYGNTGVTGLVVLALLSSGVPVDQPVVAEGLRFLRTSHEPLGGFETYQCSVMLMALAAAKQPERDALRIQGLAHRLESFQVPRGPRAGMWNYGRGLGAEDNSNTQFAILGLREAAVSGVSINGKTWELAAAHYIDTQNPDGGWGYHVGQPSTGSMTCSGIGSLVICDQILSAGEDDRNADGTPKCCSRTPHSNQALRRGLEWLGRHFAVGVNPGEQGGMWPLYYLYGVERAGRLSARRFFGPHDWYREGAAYFVDRQSRQDGSFTGTTAAETDPVVASSFSLLFLSKGLAPVLINKLNYGPSGEARRLDDETLPDWNRHPNDIRNLTEFTSGLPRWPKLLTYQEVDLDKVMAQGSVRDLLQAPILYLSGVDDPKFTDAQVQLLRSYVEQGGFIFAVNNCNGAGFDEGIRSLASRIYASGEAQLKRLPPEHPIYRAEFPLDPEAVELWGVDFGCRTSFVYSPQDHSCLWDKWSFQPVPKRTPQFNALLLRSMRVGVNVVAYATGREPYDKLDAPQEDTASGGPQDKIERGLLQVAKLRHTGDWDAAPRALHNVLLALNRTSGPLASTHQKNLVPSDENLRTYPLAYLHGRSAFQFSPQEINKLREYLNGGAVLFSDACCGSPQFDQSFRNLVRQLFPDQKFERIPITHELFSQGIGFDIRKVKRRIPQSGNLTDPLDPTLREGEPFLEGIQIKGRYCIIYSKYDISCALERQASVACAGYDYQDAVRIAVNVIRYALLQDISYADKIR